MLELDDVRSVVDGASPFRVSIGGTWVLESKSVLVVDDDPMIVDLHVHFLKSQGITKVTTCGLGAEVLELMSKNTFDLVLLDITLPDYSGLDLLPHIVSIHPEISVIMLTGRDDVSTAVRCINDGAFDYMVKPIELNAFRSATERAIDLTSVRRSDRGRNEATSCEDLQFPEVFHELITSDPKMFEVFRYVEDIRASKLPVLITGETGVGKDLLAQSIHAVGGYEGSFTKINMAGIDDALFADALFGHASGAYTGADQARVGQAALADKGVLFLDEIGELSALSQMKLLEFLQDGTYVPVGSDTPVRSTARVVMASLRNLETMCAEGTFRTDLYFRMRAHQVHLPALRERRGDIALLLGHFLDQAAKEMGGKRLQPDRDLVEALKEHDFPGNVRELKFLVHDAVARSPGKTLTPETVFNRTSRNETLRLLPSTDGVDDFAEYLASIERIPELRDAARLLIAEALSRTNGNQTSAARILGMTRSALSKRLSRSPEPVQQQSS